MANTKAHARLSHAAQHTLHLLNEHSDRVLVAHHIRHDGQDGPVYRAWIRDEHASRLSDMEVMTVHASTFRVMLRDGWLAQVRRYVSHTMEYSGDIEETIVTCYRPSKEVLNGSNG